jgi:hypothetical protein
MTVYCTESLPNDESNFPDRDGNVVFRKMYLLSEIHTHVYNARHFYRSLRILSVDVGDLNAIQAVGNNQAIWSSGKHPVDLDTTLWT